MGKSDSGDVVEKLKEAGGPTQNCHIVVLLKRREQNYHIKCPPPLFIFKEHFNTNLKGHVIKT